MKEIIEKYKSGELSLDEFLKSGLKLEECDVCRSDSHFTVQAYSLCRWNDPEDGDDEYKIVNSAQLDKEIAAMEKQYKYEKADYDRLSNSIRDFEMGQKFYRELDGKYYEASHAQEVLSLHINDALLVKVEVTQEDLEAQKVEELGRELLAAYEHCNGTWQDKFEAVARRSMEWMKQEG